MEAEGGGEHGRAGSREGDRENPDRRDRGRPDVPGRRARPDARGGGGRRPLGPVPSVDRPGLPRDARPGGVAAGRRLAAVREASGRQLAAGPHAFLLTVNVRGATRGTLAYDGVFPPSCTVNTAPVSRAVWGWL